MIRRLGASLLACGALAAPASASTLPELPVTAMDGNPGCLGATGAPGELTFSAAGPGGVRFLRADRTGVTRAQTLAVPSCSTVVSRPNGAAVAAGSAESGVVAAIRDPGGAWGMPLDLVYPSAWHTRSVAAAVSDRGDAVVAWTEDTFDEPDSEPKRLRVARRAPGGGFGDAQTLVTGETEIENVQTGIAANGDAFVLWTTTEGAYAPYRSAIRVAGAPAGQPFGQPSIVGTMPWRSSAALAVAQDGRAIVAFRQERSMVVAERSPGGTFGGAGVVGAADDAIGVVAQAAIDDGGRAAIAWRGIDSAGAKLVSRAAPGPFSSTVQLVQDLGPDRGADPFYATESYARVSGWIGYPPASDLILTPGGQVVYAAAADVPQRDAYPQSANLFTLPLGGAQAQRATSRPAFDVPERVRAFLLADGTPATAYTWANASREGPSNVHVAAEGVVGVADGPLPTVRLRGLGSPVVGENAVRVRLTCGGPCDVSAEIAGHPGFSEPVRMPNGGTRTVVLLAATPFVPRRLGPVRVRLTYGAPNAQHPRTRTFTLRLRRGPATPRPHVTRVSAVRQGNRVIVRWAVSRPLSGYIAAVVSGAPARKERGEPLQAVGVDAEHPRRSFTTRLTQRTKTMRWVTLRTFDEDPITVRVH